MSSGKNRGVGVRFSLPPCGRLEGAGIMYSLFLADLPLAKLQLVTNWERSMSSLYIVTLLIYLICRVHHENARLDEAQAGIKIAGRNINNLSYTDDTTRMAESEEELKSLLMKVKEESEKVDLKLNI